MSEYLRLKCAAVLVLLNAQHGFSRNLLGENSFSNMMQKSLRDFFNRPRDSGASTSNSQYISFLNGLSDSDPESLVGSNSHGVDLGADFGKQVEDVRAQGSEQVAAIQDQAKQHFTNDNNNPFFEQIQSQFNDRVDEVFQNLQNRPADNQDQNQPEPQNPESDTVSPLENPPPETQSGDQPVTAQSAEVGIEEEQPSAQESPNLEGDSGSLNGDQGRESTPIVVRAPTYGNSSAPAGTDSPAGGDTLSIDEIPPVRDQPSEGDAPPVQDATTGATQGPDAPSVGVTSELEERVQSTGAGGAGTALEEEECDDTTVGDMIVDQEVLRDSLILDKLTADQGDCFINEGCITGPGERTILRFTVRILNIGTEDVRLCDQPPCPTLQETQDPSFEFTQGRFNWDTCHFHWHFTGYALYTLHRNANGESQEVFGGKNGFCLADTDCSTGTPKFTCSNQGISAGCYDQYVRDLNCQWIDVTDFFPQLGEGEDVVEAMQGDETTYTLSVDLNTDRLIPESNFDNNKVSVDFKIKDLPTQLLGRGAIPEGTCEDYQSAFALVGK